MIMGYYLSRPKLTDKTSLCKFEIDALLGFVWKSTVEVPASFKLKTNLPRLSDHSFAS